MAVNNSVGAALVGPATPAQIMQGPPAPMQGPPAPMVPTAAPGPTIPQPPPGLNPLQKIAFQMRYDPNVRKAMQVAGLNLMGGKSSSFQQNLSQAGLQGLSTLQQLREQQKAEAAAAAKAAQDAKAAAEKLRMEQEQLQQNRDADRRSYGLQKGNLEVNKGQLAEQKRHNEATEKNQARQIASGKSSSQSTEQWLINVYAKDMRNKNPQLSEDESLKLAADHVATRGNKERMVRELTTILNTDILYDKMPQSEKQKIIQNAINTFEGSTGPVIGAGTLPTTAPNKGEIQRSTGAGAPTAPAPTQAPATNTNAVTQPALGSTVTVNGTTWKVFGKGTDGQTLYENDQGVKINQQQLDAITKATTLPPVQNEQNLGNAMMNTTLF